jgi:hypothetical protein
MSMSQDLPASLPDRPCVKEAVSHLNSYTTAALAAGVSLLAMAQPAASEVVMTHKTIQILPRSIISTSVPLDINGDGVTDFSFGFTSFGPYSYITANLSFANKPGNGVIAKGAALDTPLVDVLSRGAKVGPSDKFNGAPDLLIQQSDDIEHNSVCTDQKAYGNWNGNKPDRFVGVKFQIKGQTHYGWVRLTVDHSTVLQGCLQMSATITAYAYETVPNRAITIGSGGGSATAEMVQPKNQAGPSLGMLALGMPSLQIWRRE